jgi:hypothetical protein
MFENNMFKTMIEFNKAAFNKGYDAVVSVQEQNEKMMNGFMDQNNFMPKEGREVIDQWVDLYKKGREDYKKMMDDGFIKAEGFFKNTTKVKNKNA